MAYRKKLSSRTPAAPPADAGEGAARIREAVVKLFDQGNGDGADWKLLLESLFRAGFEMADEKLDDSARQQLMQRFFDIRAYDRAAGNVEAVKAFRESASHVGAGPPLPDSQPRPHP